MFAKLAVFVAIIGVGLAFLPDEHRLREVEDLERTRTGVEEARMKLQRQIGPHHDAVVLSKSEARIAEEASNATAAEAAGPARLAPTLSVSPSAFCASLSAAGYANSGWAESPLFPGEWECLTGWNGKGGRNGDGQGGQTFLSVKGKDRDAVNIIRLKMNFETDVDGAKMMAVVKPLLDVLAASGDLPVDELAGDITAMKPFRIAFGNGRSQFFREHGSVPRYNLIFDFPH